MKSSELIKVAGFLNKLQDRLNTTTESDTTARTRRALTFGGLGAGLGAAGGYFNAAKQVSSNPLQYRDVMTLLVDKPNLWRDALKGGLAGYLDIHRHLVPAIVRTMPGKIALPALALGAFGGWAGLRSNAHKTNSKE